MIQSHFFNLFSYASTYDFTSFSKNLEKNTEKSGKHTSKNWDISFHVPNRQGNMDSQLALFQQA